ncbi:hypothetical protein E2542_SST02503 [Spatholobus suberectus]|nr:hypothetical protein E2542_SST02503 [Spatholobus suberectus]
MPTTKLTEEVESRLLGELQIVDMFDWPFTMLLFLLRLLHLCLRLPSKPATVVTNSSCRYLTSSKLTQRSPSSSKGKEEAWP